MANAGRIGLSSLVATTDLSQGQCFRRLVNSGDWRLAVLMCEIPLLARLLTYDRCRRTRREKTERSTGWQNAAV